ncbi:MAG: AMP-binding protein, partial [Hellea sp.]|nr:AMP-binding protein [Hellea sp.]
MPLDFENLQKNKANYVNLTPLSFLNRTADIYPDRPAIIYNDIKYNWEEVRKRCLSIAAYLKGRGIGKSDTVSLLTFNTPEMFEAHYAIPMSGAVLNTINTRLDANTVGYIIDHAESKLFIVDRELWPTLKEALLICKTKPEIVIIDDPA